MQLTTQEATCDSTESRETEEFATLVAGSRPLVQVLGSCHLPKNGLDRRVWSWDVTLQSDMEDGVARLGGGKEKVKLGKIT